LRQVEVAVIGAGPAGLSAAIAAAEAGAHVLLLDENVQPGGQIHRQFPQSFEPSGPNVISPEQAEGRTLVEHARALPIEWLTNTVVWGIFDRKHLCAIRGAESLEIWAERLILAPGAHERPVPFPGWTLPGVMMAGGVQNLMKSQWILPGERFLLAGTGPLQLALASQLLENQAEVVGIVDASSRQKYARLIPSLWGEWKTLRQGLHYLWRIGKARVPFLGSHTIIRAEGRHRVEKAVTSDVDGHWRPIPGTERTWSVNAICLGFGFVSSVELAALAGCRMQYVPKLGCWRPEHDRDMRSSVPGVYVAGDGSGLGGAILAAHEGRIAGTNAAIELGYLKDRSPHPAAASYRRAQKLQGFRMALEEIYEFRSGLYEALRDDTLICRCEEITYAQVKEALRAGAEDVSQVKSWTRAGMGLCQGRFCEFTIAALLARALGAPLGERGRLTVRPPARPVPIEAILP
jgi:NADPH-dependent 2,4-dienoyl-CoA reductase/sulfur reductase-like enzyme